MIPMSQFVRSDLVLVCAGESGMGKSTLVNSLFLTDLYKDRKLLNAEGESLFIARSESCRGLYLSLYIERRHRV